MDLAIFISYVPHVLSPASAKQRTISNRIGSANACSTEISLMSSWVGWIGLFIR
ncbi:hypothetical protein C2W59_01624 [Bacillus pumilus]|nr:hypothetical protein C2W58_03410 [Bacillus pumilus]RAP17862.1 hypothetical protein C2W59_01624 [Bacillus pumilus]